MASVNIILKSKPNKEGEYPIIMRVIKDRKIKVITLGLKTNIKDWDETNKKFKKSHPNYIQRNRVLLKLQQKALKIIDELIFNDQDFTLDMFEEKFRGRDLSKMTVSDFWLEVIRDLDRTGKIGHSKIHKETYNSVFKFHKSKKLMFHQIDNLFLSKYEIFLRENGNKNGGIGVKMREIRSLYNQAINQGAAKQESYPFRKFKVAKFKGTTKKEALTAEEIDLFKNLDITFHPKLKNTYNYFLFSFYARGMNFQDMMLLQWSNIEANRIHYVRAKTNKRFSILITPPLKSILDYYKNQNRNTNYVFPILLQNELTPKQIANRKAKVLKRVNSDLKKIVAILGVKKKITFYVARHSFATILKFSGVSTDKISQLMGHNNLKTTQAYLREFGDDILDEAASHLLKEPDLTYV